MSASHMSASYRSAPYRRLAFGIAAAGALALALSACTSNTPAPQEAAAPPVPEQPAIPSKYRPEDIVGRWGYGAFHRDQDLARTAAAARQQCGQPVEITRGPNGGVMMYLAELRAIAGIAAQGLAERRELYRPARTARRHAGPRDRVVRRPHHGAALDGSGSRRPLRHRRLCALRARRHRARRRPAADEAGGAVRLRSSFRGRAQRGARNPYTLTCDYWIPDLPLRGNPE